MLVIMLESVAFIVFIKHPFTHAQLGAVVRQLGLTVKELPFFLEEGVWVWVNKAGHPVPTGSMRGPVEGKGEVGGMLEHRTERSFLSSAYHGPWAP